MHKTFEMNVVPKLGQAILYVRLSDVENLTITETLSLLEDLGYSPELRYSQWVSDPRQVTLYAFLKEESLPYGSTGEDSRLNDEYWALTEKIQPVGAVRYAWANHNQPAIAV